MSDLYVIRHCTNPLCDFRFPAPEDGKSGLTCPTCKSRTLVVDRPRSEPGDYDDALGVQPQRRVEVLLDNIRSIYNVGAIFRTSDGVGVQALHLCGITATPEHPKLAKTALGADEFIPWQHYRNSLTAVRTLKEKGYAIWGLENTVGSRNLLQDSELIARLDRPLLLIVGNEVTGIDPGLLDLCDETVALPMLGRKKSLNVTIAFGAAVYQILHT